MQGQSSVNMSDLSLPGATNNLDTKSIVEALMKGERDKLARQETEVANLKEQKAGVRLVAVEPAESPTISRGVFHPHRMMGTAPGFVPETLDRALLDDIVLVSEAEAFAMCRRIAREEGLLVGISSGATAHAALDIAGKMKDDPVIVCIFADTGQRYLSVEGLFEQ